MHSALSVLLLMGVALWPSSAHAQRERDWNVPIKGRLLLTVYETHDYDRPTEPSDPALVLEVATEGSYPCTGYELPLRVERRAGTVRLHADSVRALSGLCGAAVTPAVTIVPLPNAAGEYRLEVRVGAVTDHHRVNIMPTAVRLRPDPASRVSRLDARPYWRYPVNSFALACNATTDSLIAFCERVARRVARSSGISAFTFAATGRVPVLWANAPGWRTWYYRYDAEAHFDAVRACVTSWAPHVRESVGIRVHLLGWRRQGAEVQSRRSYHEAHQPVPTELATTPECTERD